MQRPMDAWRSDVPGVAAHRGGRALAPENTIFGMRTGLSAGATHIEVDVRGTADGVAVCMHDENALRTCGEDAVIEDLTLDEVKQLDPCSLWSEHAGISTGDQDPPRGTPRRWFQVPALEEVLETFPGVPIILDLKDTAPPEGVAEAVDEAWRRPEDLAIGGYDDEILDATADRLPDVPRGPGYDRTEAFYSGEEIDVDVVFVPPEHEGLDLVYKEAVERAHDMGAGFWVWTINARGRAAELMDLGVDGVITDQPGKIASERKTRLRN